jgi:hypothetical protein
MTSVKLSTLKCIDISDYKCTQGPDYALVETVHILQNIARTTECNNVQVNIVNNSEIFGNSSVSMGLAVMYFKTHKKTVFNVVNIGTGNPKFQSYAYDPVSELVTVLSEYKPKLKYNYHTFDEKTESSYINEFNIHFTKVKEDCSTWFAFVTGTLRASYAKVDIDNKIALDKRAIRVFELFNIQPHTDIDFQHPSYYLSQIEEATYELTATQNTYKGMGEPIPCMCIGIGNWSCQLTYQRADGIIVTMKHGAGMQNTDQLKKVVKSFNVPSAVFKGHANPTIALKSGCLLRYDKLLALIVGNTNTESSS